MHKCKKTTIEFSKFNTVAFLLAIALFSATNLANAQLLDGIRVDEGTPLFGIFPEEGGNLFLVANNSPVGAGAITFTAEPGILQQGDDPSPFQFFIPDASAPGNVTLGSLGTPVTIDGTIELDVAVSPNTPDGSISGIWGSGFHAPLPIFRTPSVPTITCFIPEDELVGDLDDNGTVEFSDFLVLAGNFGLEVDTYGDGDINCNGTVDFEDFIRLGGNFGQSRPAVAAVPEPSAISLLLIGIFFAAQFCRKGPR